MFKNAKIFSLASFAINSEKPVKFASPADPQSTIVVTPVRKPACSGRIEISVAPK